MSYIEENGYFIFDGIKSSDYGVWIHGGGTYNAPKRRYKDYTVPGRNGTLTIDEGVFEEIEVVYPAFIARDFPANIEAFRNELMSRSGYVRMTDSYHPDEYYLAKYMDGLDADVAPGGVGAQFNLTFKRDPRRFLVSGETPITLGVPTDIQTVSGSIVSIDADADTKITSVVADINPVQDLHGYDSPWAGGNGKNLIPYPYYQTTRTVNGVTFTDNGDGTITVNGTNTGSSTAEFVMTASSQNIVIPAGSYFISGCTGGSSTTYLIQWNPTGGAVVNNYDGSSAVDLSTDTAARVSIKVISGTTVNNVTFKPMLRLASDTGDTWVPYANICPITGHTEANVTVSPTTDAQDGTTYHITFPASAGTVYGGTLDVVSGLLTVDKAFATLTGASGEDWRAATQSDFVGFYLNNTATVLSGRKASGDIAVNEFVRVQGSGWSALTAPGQMLYVSNINIRVNNAVIGSTVEELRTWLAENPIEIAYELATPQTYQLTPQEISTLLGTNNIWADTGDVSVEYGTVLSSVENPTLFDSKPLIRATFDTANENYVKMPYSDGSPYEMNGITYTTEADGSIRVFGTCGSTRSYFSFRAYNDPIHLPPGNYHFECCPSGGGSNNFYASIWHRYNGAQVGTAKWDYGTGGVDFTITETESQYDTMIQIYVQPGVTIDELFTPSLVADTDEVYFYVGSDKITLQNRFAYIDIDSDIQDCYSDYSNANPYVQFQSNDFPVLEPGVTGITIGAGLESIAITPRWFRL